MSTGGINLKSIRFSRYGRRMMVEAFLEYFQVLNKRQTTLGLRDLHRNIRVISAINMADHSSKKLRKLRIDEFVASNPKLTPFERHLISDFYRRSNGKRGPVTLPPYEMSKTDQLYEKAELIYRERLADGYLGDVALNMSLSIDGRILSKKTLKNRVHGRSGFTQRRKTALRALLSKKPRAQGSRKASKL